MGIKRALGPPMAEFAVPVFSAAYLVQTQIAGTVVPGPVGLPGDVPGWELFTRQIECRNTEQVLKQSSLYGLRHNTSLLFGGDYITVG